MHGYRVVVAVAVVLRRGEAKATRRDKRTGRGESEGGEGENNKVKAVAVIVGRDEGTVSASSERERVWGHTSP